MALVCQDHGPHQRIYAMVPSRYKQAQPLGIVKVWELARVWKEEDLPSRAIVGKIGRHVPGKVTHAMKDMLKCRMSISNNHINQQVQRTYRIFLPMRRSSTQWECHFSSYLFIYPRVLYVLLLIHTCCSHNNCELFTQRENYARIRNIGRA